jgi:flagellar assembly protein FliH
MKSLPNILAAGDNGAASWAPEDFGVPVNLVPEGRVQDLITLLQLDASRVGRPKISAVRASTQAEVKASSVWEPLELTWASPFAAEDWAEMDGASLAQADKDAARSAAAQRAVVSEEVQKAEAQAAAILAQAQQEAEGILQEVQKSVDEAQQQIPLAMEESRAQGYREGWEKANAESATVLKSVAEIMIQFTAWRDDMFSKSEPMLIEMVKQIGRAMFGDGMTLDGKAMEINLNRVVENAKSLGDIKVYLNPGDAEHLDPTWREYQQLISGNRVQIVPSDGITKGGCFVQGQLGTVDARVETQMKAVLEVFNQEESTEAA